MTNRGFTTQEHMQDAPTGINLANLINLNRRLYDPQLARIQIGRIISADPRPFVGSSHSETRPGRARRQRRAA